MRCNGPGAGNVQSDMGKHRCATVAFGLLIAGSLVACGQTAGNPQSGGSVSDSTTPEPTSASPSSSPTPSPSLSTGASTQPTVDSTVTGSKTPGQMTIRGQVEEGVEAGCLLLKADGGKEYLLVGGDRAAIRAGGQLEVVGEPQPGLITTCQQGTPFAVAQVHRI